MDKQNNNYIEHKIKLLSYHHGAMETRRSLGFKAFLALISFQLITIKGASEIFSKIIIIDHIKILIITLYIFLYLFFVFFLFQIEVRNKSDRQKYRKMEAEVFGQIYNSSDLDLETKEKKFYSVKQSWATTWPVFSAGIITFVCSCIIYNLKFCVI